MNTTIAILLNALIAVESCGNPAAIGDNGQAVGVLQIHPECVRDVNRITGKSYTLQDRASASKSREICAAYLKHYGRLYERRTGKTATGEVYARIWNGGPNGYRREGTRAYWRKVQAAMNTGARSRQRVRKATATPKRQRIARQ